MKLTTTLYHKTNQTQAKTDHCIGLNVVTHLDTIKHEEIKPTSKFHPLNETGVNKELAIMLLAILTRWTRLYEPLEM